MRDPRTIGNRKGSFGTATIQPRATSVISKVGGGGDRFVPASPLATRMTAVNTQLQVQSRHDFSHVDGLLITNGLGF